MPKTISISLGLALAGLISVPAFANFSTTIYGPGPANWGSSDEHIQMGGSVVEDFESTKLVPGLLIGVSTPSGASYGPTSTLPALFDPAADPNGADYTKAPWDGSHALINSADNAAHSDGDTADFGVLTLLFTQPTNRIGFSVEDVTGPVSLYVNGSYVSNLRDLTANVPPDTRDAYYEVSSGSPDVFITSVVLDNSASGDGFAIDHVAYTTPEPTSLCIALLAPISFGRRAPRRR